MLFKTLKLTRTLRLMITRGREPGIYTIGHLPAPLDLNDIHKRLSPLGFQYNYMSLTSYPGQVFQLRSHTKTPVFQTHIRFYKNGRVSAHHEYNPEYFFWEHCKGIECHPLNRSQLAPILQALGMGD